MIAKLLPFLLAGSLGQSGEAANLDFSRPSLEGWEGSGFYLTAGGPQGPGTGHGVCSSDGGNPSRKGLLRHVLVVPRGTGQLVGQAYAAFPSGMENDARLDVVVADGENRLVPRRVRSTGGWVPAPTLLPRWRGEARTYSWDLSGYGERTVQVALIDRDDRPGRHVFATGFRFVPAQDFADEEFLAVMRDLADRHRLAPFSRYDGRRFTAMSNAGETFSLQRVRFCEIFYDLFFAHFRGRGFRLHAPATRLMVAVFDGPQGFEAYLGRPMPAGITGMYEAGGNRLVLYDLAENRQVLKERTAALKMVARFGGKDRVRRVRVDTIRRRFEDLTHDANLSTTMHEAAHQLSFNCGLLRRDGDVPLWLAEGLACYCEATSEGDWQALGSVNPARLDTLRPVLAGRGRFLPLRDLVVSDRWRDGRQVLLGYAQSWALFHQLMLERPDDLRRYLDLLKHRRAADHRLTDFLQVFGADLGKLENDHQAYIRTQAERTPPVRLR